MKRAPRTVGEEQKVKSLKGQDEDRRRRRWKSTRWSCCIGRSWPRVKQEWCVQEIWAGAGAGAHAAWRQRRSGTKETTDEGREQLRLLSSAQGTQARADPGLWTLGVSSPALPPKTPALWLPVARVRRACPGLSFALAPPHHPIPSHLISPPVCCKPSLPAAR